MFATDWLMLSQVSNWRTYPQHVREGLEAIAGSQDVAKILGRQRANIFRANRDLTAASLRLTENSRRFSEQNVNRRHQFR
jgi:hypothetical protein